MTQSTFAVDIAILGAGPAGIGAARYLKAQGHKSVVILEAQNHIGGRVQTLYPWQSVPLNLGATWIHGIKDNPIYDFAVNGGFVKAYSTRDKSVPHTYYFDEGKEIPRSEKKEMRKQIKQVFRELESHLKNATEDTSLRDAMRKYIANYSEWTNGTTQLSRMFLAHVAFMETFDATTLDQLSSKNYFIPLLERDGDVYVGIGYQSVIDKMAEGLDIRFRNIVEHIDYSKDDIIVTTNQSVITCRKCIITFPLGVLKEIIGRDFFQPALPTEKTEVIKRMGMGVINKIFLRFSSSNFWDNKYTFIIPIQGQSPTPFLSFRVISNERDQIILQVWIAPGRSHEVESWSKDQIIEGVIARLRGVFPGKEIPAPAEMFMTRWSSEQFTRGSYSFNRIGAHIDDPINLAVPVHHKLYFAGEATSKDHIGTVNGAYISGVQAATQALGSSTALAFASSATESHESSSSAPSSKVVL